MEISPSLAVALAFAVLFVLIFLKLPVAFALALVGFLGIYYLAGYKAAVGTFASTFWAQSTSYTLMAVPLFMLMGQLASYSGIGADLYDTAFKWLGKLPGGLAIATVWGCAGFAACTGSSTSGVVTFGPIAYKPMMDKNYSKRLALGTICCSATMGSMIPPSIAFIIYASVTQESVGKLFMAGVFPGILQAALYSVAIFMLTGFGIWSGPSGGSSTWREKASSLKGVWGMLVLFGLVIGGIYGGIFTPTEAAAIGAFGALVVLVTRKGLRWAPIKLSIIDTIRTACFVYFLIIGSMVFAYFVGLAGVNLTLVNMLTGWNVSPVLVLWVFLLILIALGCVMPPLPLIVLTVPFLYPIFTEVFHFNGIWLGVLMVVEVEFASITPPVGMNLFVIKSLFGDEAPMGDIFMGSIPFVLVDLVRLILLVAFPIISLWLPGTMSQVPG